MAEKGVTFQIGVACPFPVSSPIMSSQAIKNVRKLNIGLDKDSKLLPVPTGNPMFMFCSVPGKTRDVNIMLDSGCSHACLKFGAVIHQLNGFCTAKGEFPVNVAGGSQIVAKGEWMVSLKKRSGDHQAVVGLALDQVTVDFPRVSLSGAVAAIKSSAPKNKFVQECAVPESAGGSVDILLGIQYASLFPKLIHMLPCGLGIYELELEAPNGQFNACIAGPHETLAALSLQAGGTRRLFSHFMQGLGQWRHTANAAPKLFEIPPTNQELELNYSANCLEDESGLVKALDLNEVYEEEEHSVSQSYCAHHHSHITDDEKLSSLKRCIPPEIPLDLDYRCVKCRSCSKCLDADNQENISLREEAELEQCRESVKLDYANQRIICSLPLRGEEEKFLGPNRDIALKILDQQTRKYKGNLEVEQLILKAFEKMFKNGHIRFIRDLTETELQAFSNKRVQNYIPWRIAFSGSATTPARPVFDASTRTNKNPDNSGGRCFNDLTCKGKITTLNLTRLLLRFMVGKVAVAGDLSQFYNTCKLIPSQWNLQRILWKPNLHPAEPVEEAVITTLIYGQISASCQSECAMEKLADDYKSKYPDVSSFLLKSRYVDDLGESKSSYDELEQLAHDTDKVLSSVGINCKGWTMTGNTPSDVVSKDGSTIGVGGFKWNPVEDTLQVKVPYLFFSKKSRGRLSEDTVFFNADIHSIEEFVPKDLTLRLVTSKFASIFDYLGFLSPALARAKRLLRATCKATIGWNDSMSQDLRDKWLKEFVFIEKLRGLKYKRAKMPEDAIDSRMRILCGGDAAEEMLILGAWGGFKRLDGSWSCQLLVGKSLLSAETWTIPMGELVALMGSGNLSRTLFLALTEWIDPDMVYNFSDSNIALCWASTEGKKMSTFHRNRVVQIRRSINLKNLFHVKTKFQPCDIGTRPDKVNAEDVGPDSNWFNGLSWMHLDIEQAVEEEILTPVEKLRLSDEEKKDYKRGLVIDSEPEILTYGHVATEKRIQAILDRAKFSKDLYIINPGRFSFRKSVRIVGYVFAFASKLMRRALGREPTCCILKGGNKIVSAFSSLMGVGENQILCLPNVVEVQEKVDVSELVSLFDPKAQMRNVQADPEVSLYKASHSDGARLSDKFLSQALVHFYKVATLEVKQFNGKDWIGKVAYEEDGILFSKNRLHEGLSFVTAGELSNINLGDLGINISSPLIDRYSELAYSIGNHMHYIVSRHKGFETTHRMTLEHVTIVQGMSLHREIASDCFVCKKKQKRFLEVEMGPRPQSTLTIAPPFYTTVMDLMGPFMVYVPGFEARTRNRKVLEAKTWVVVFCCPATRNINLQVVEKVDGDGIVDSIIRLSCEVGVPKFVLCDKQTSVERTLREAQIEMRDVQDKLVVESGIEFFTCPVSGHNFHGQVERCVRSVRDALAETGAFKKALHATGLQTVMKMIENQINNVPLGYAYGRDSDNSPALRIITPSMLRHGRNNMRALDGPIELADGYQKMMERVDQTYQAWFKVWRDAWVPKLMHSPKWFKSDVDLNIGDLVYFQRTANELGSKYGKWTVGEVNDLERGKDNKIRRVWVKYRNVGESNFQKTERSVRSLIKIFSLLDSSIQEDLGEVHKFMRGLSRRSDDVHSAVLGVSGGRFRGEYGSCCSAHSNRQEVQTYLEDYLEEDLSGVGVLWDQEESVAYGDGLENKSLESLLGSVLQMEF